MAQYAALQGTLEQGPLSAEEGVFSARHAFLIHFTEQDMLAHMRSVETYKAFGCVCVFVCTLPPPACVSAQGAVMNALGD